MLESAAIESLAVARRRESRCEEWREHIRLAELLARYLDPACTFWTSLENKPISAVTGMYQKMRGVRSGLPDVTVMHAGLATIFIELKSRRGNSSKVQIKLREEMLTVGAGWWMARSARAAMVALHLSGVTFRRKWERPQLQPWEGPFADPTQRLPQHPAVAKRKREEKRRYRLRKKLREQETARLSAQQRSDFPTSTRGDGELPGTSCCTPRQRSRPGDQLPSKTKFVP